MPETKRPILLSAGGTGGHLFPAEALAEVLVQRGQTVALVTDTRVESWVARFPGDVHTLTAGTVTGSSMLGKVRGVFRLLKGVAQANSLINQLNPSVVVGFGGYPTVPPLLVASMKGIPTLIHEGNAVMGRANRFLAPRMRRIAAGFPLRHNEHAEKTVLTGNPVRKPVLFAAEKNYPTPEPGGPLRVLVFGGSQGARVMSDVVPNALHNVPEALRARLHVTQQAREEDVFRVQTSYQKHGIACEVAAFFSDLPARMAESHLVIARAGASTVSELAVIGRPGILVPLPGALDQDQASNAEVITAAGGAITLPQATFTPNSLAELVERLAGDPARLTRMALAARSIGVQDAASRLASEVLSLSLPA
jgi:UDP-N-acetylglucosamine--N-acetylmuramyl-(pentapeptide) pyrophosphoryl-undecaprenol N-acetylglucosamine transferase